MAASSGKIRIIGGQWRGRKLSVANLPGLRPSADRVRETLFNWLSPSLPGARCLDLFAGSGVLGLEALSRGAAGAVLVENNPIAVTQLRQQVKILAATQVEVVCQDALQFVAQNRISFDIVFLDPPFTTQLLPAACAALQQYATLAPQAWIYLEMPRASEPLALPSGWTVQRSLQTKEVLCWLARDMTIVRCLTPQAQGDE